MRLKVMAIKNTILLRKLQLIPFHEGKGHQKVAFNGNKNASN